jgi:hypothetical protein
MITEDGREAVLIPADDESGCDRCSFVWADANCKSVGINGDGCAAGCEGHFRWKDAGNAAISDGATEQAATVRAAQVCRECNNN